ncbi:hypothetical protein EYZ11_012190 [Aspergillus tanneri]|uniref:Uncharacterized protein n=1 Tax=Aspergillus tanneri TaxID=1220188 RepID=A0A4S3J2Z8_9EURO|nr:hypothetical protein EYZ11_012190 [Aspergillus tanneri]
MYNTTPDTPSPIYPDRLIRPLPKRTLRSRLSSDAADSILFPPTPSATHLFYGADTGEVVNDSKIYVQESDSHDPERDRRHPYANGARLESDEDDGPVVVRRSAGFRGSSLSPSTQPQLLPSNGEAPPTKSSSAGPDGYDAFENTNNKKKRKIPTPGSLGGHHSTLSPEFSSMGLANSSQPLSSASGEGSHWELEFWKRSPGALSTTSHGPGESPAATAFPGQLASWSSPSSSRRSSVLSRTCSAAANAFSSSPRGSGSVSMLEQQATTPTKTQFTFTCESDSSRGMALQTQNTYQVQHRSSSSLPAAPQNQRASSTQGTQTSPRIAPQMNSPAPGAEPPAAGRKKKRSPGSMYALAARQRKIRQQYSNLHHPPSLEDIWICEFCEYESIFGRPPEALIRQYEIKDRKERKRLAEKKRLLEKAKMKGRKNKKATKNAAKNAVSQQATYEQGYDRASADRSPTGGTGFHDDDDYLAHDDDDEQASVPPGPPPGSFKTPLPHGHPPTVPPGAKDAADETSRPP